MSAFPGGRAPVRCEICRARDAHDAAHQAGCPALAPADPAALVRLAHAIERGWAEVPARPAPRPKNWIRANMRELQARRSA